MEKTINKTVKIKQNKYEEQSSKVSKTVIRRVIFTILSFVCMITIFLFSSRNAVLSTQDSLSVGMTIGDITIEDFDQWSEPDQIEFASSIDHPVRKAAHFTEYTILGCLLFGAWYDKKHKMRAINQLLPIIIGALYSCSDEMHQLFIAGRSGQITDILLDTSGVIFGVLLISFILFIIHKGQRARKAH